MEEFYEEVVRTTFTFEVRFDTVPDHTRYFGLVTNMPGTMENSQKAGMIHRHCKRQSRMLRIPLKPRHRKVNQTQRTTTAHHYHPSPQHTLTTHHPTPNGLGHRSRPSPTSKPTTNKSPKTRLSPAKPNTRSSAKNERMTANFRKPDSTTSLRAPRQEPENAHSKTNASPTTPTGPSQRQNTNPETSTSATQTSWAPTAETS
jgi:hypothetical protein